ncbi:MFS transporter (plasmid) [Streptomyces sp. BI20]|uniref:MFS transporter n=1 Tax=Streptomyces sp. BI20 TaxID=3403460 RepID=UPI003C78D5FC
MSPAPAPAAPAAVPPPVTFRRAQVAIAALFCALGFQYATWAARLPTLKTRLDLSETEVGLLLMICGIGAAASFPLVTWLMRRLGSRTLALGSALALALLLPALAAAPAYPVALVVICLDGVLVGCLNVAMNAQGAAAEVVFGRTAMARFHATFSAGSLLAALLAGGLHLLTDDLTTHFALAAVLVLALVGLTRGGLLPEPVIAAGTAKPAADEAAEAGAGTGKPAGRRWTLPTLATLWMGAAMVFGTVTEGAMNDWSALYLKDVVQAGPAVAPLGIAAVAGMMVLARVFADGWRERWGDGRVVRVGSALAAVGLAAALLAGGVVPTLIGFACVGLGVAAVTPCVYAAAARSGSDALSLVAATGTAGLLAGPAVIGFIADGAGLVWGMATVAVSSLLVTACATRITWPAPAGAPAPATPTDAAPAGTDPSPSRA